jgi:Zn-dependent protease
MVQMPRTPNHELAIAAAGPAVSLALGVAGLALGALLPIPLFGSINLFATIGAINLVLAAFNLIPALPMDGGRILRALLARKVSYVRATDIAVTVARVVSVGFVIAGLMGWYQLLLLAPFLWMMGTRERALARSASDPFGGYASGAGGFWRGNAPARGDRPGGFYRDDGLPLRRFTIRHVGGRMVIEPLD